MPPQFLTPEALQQADQLMQPALIRLLDNLRKQLEVSPWTSRYETEQIWAEEVSEADRARWQLLGGQLRGATPEEVDAIEAAIAQLPQPRHVYWLHLSQDERVYQVNLWELCYQICCQNYEVDLLGKQPAIASSTVSIDTTLFDEDCEVEWDQLDTKTKQVVEQLFNRLASFHC